MIRRRRLAALTVVSASVLALGLAGCGDDDGADGASSDVALSPVNDSGVTGSVDLTQDGDRLTGVIEVVGLEPGSGHAAHLHGVAGEDHGCAEAKRTTSHLVSFPAIEAGDDGVGRIDVEMEAPADSVRSGTYVMVHQDPPTDDVGHDSSGGDDETDAEQSSAARIILVHNGEDHSTEAEEEQHAATAGMNPPIACGELGDS